MADQYPELRVEVTELELEAALPGLNGGTFDIVLAEEYPGRPLALSPSTERHDLLQDELLLGVPTNWPTARPADLANRPMALEPTGTTARRWAENRVQWCRCRA